MLRSFLARRGDTATSQTLNVQILTSEPGNVNLGKLLLVRLDNKIFGAAVLAAGAISHISSSAGCGKSSPGKSMALTRSHPDPIM